MTKGIDVSKHNGVIDWKNVKADGVQFAILRAGFGREASQKDVQFENNYKGCTANSIPCGVYWYSYAMSADEARKEAAVCLETIKGKQLDYPVYFDIEEKKQLELGKAACTEITKAFLEVIENAGYWAGIYSSKSHLESYIDEAVRSRYAVWVAHYGVEKTTYKGQFGMWQKSDTGKVSGINGNVDMNECYIEYPTEIKNKGLNGYKKSTASVKQTVKTDVQNSKPEYVKYTVKRGDSLWSIAQKYLGKGSRYKEIMYASGITSEKIYPKQVLTIPKK